MDFCNLETGELIVRLKGPHVGRYEYGLIKSMNNSLRYYSLSFLQGYTGKLHFSNNFLVRAVRDRLNLPSKCIYGVTRNEIKEYGDEIENLANDIYQNNSAEELAEMYMEYAVLPSVQYRWKNRIWPIDEDKADLNTTEEKVLEVFKNKGDFQ